MASSSPTLLPREPPLTTTTTGKFIKPVVDIRGTTITGYLVHTWIGGGRLADVFRGTDSQGRDVAIKAAPARFPSPLQMELDILKFLFQRGAAVPHAQPLITLDQVVAKDNDCGFTSCDVMVMDYLSPTLETLRVGKKAMPHPDLLRIARDAVFGILDIHQLGIIHGGITERSLAFEGGRLVYTDFGRACFRAHFEDVSEDIDDTEARRIEVTRRSDMRALALVLMSLTGANVPRLPPHPLAEDRVRFQDEVSRLDVIAMADELPLSLYPLRSFVTYSFALGVEEEPQCNLLWLSFSRV